MLVIYVYKPVYITPSQVQLISLSGCENLERHAYQFIIKDTVRAAGGEVLWVGVWRLGSPGTFCLCPGM